MIQFKDADNYFEDSVKLGITNVQLGEHLKKSTEEIGELNNNFQRMEECLKI